MGRNTHQQELEKLQHNLGHFHGTLLNHRCEIVAHEFEPTNPTPTNLIAYLSHLIDTVSVLETNISEQLDNKVDGAATGGGERSDPVPPLTPPAKPKASHLLGLLHKRLPSDGVCYVQFPLSAGCARVRLNFYRSPFKASGNPRIEGHWEIVTGAYGSCRSGWRFRPQSV